MTYGMRASLGLNFQNSYGTALTSSLYWLPFMSEGVTLTKNQLVSQALRGVYDEGAHYEGTNEIAGDIEMEANPLSLGVFLKALCGNPTTVTSGGVYTHTFKPRTSDFDQYALGIPFTLVKNTGDTGSMHQYYDLVATALNLSVANGEFLKTTLSVLGGKFAQVGSIAPSYPGESKWTWDVTSVSVAGTANGDIKELGLTLDETGENHYTLNGSKYPSRTKRSGFRTLAIDGTLVFENQTEYQQFISQSERALIVHLRTGNQIQSGYYEAFTIKVPGLRYAEFPITADGPGKIEAAFSAKGVYSVSSQTAIEFVLVNTQAAY